MSRTSKGMRILGEALYYGFSVCIDMAALIYTLGI